MAKPPTVPPRSTLVKMPAATMEVVLRTFDLLDKVDNNKSNNFGRTVTVLAYPLLLDSTEARTGALVDPTGAKTKVV